MSKVKQIIELWDTDRIGNDVVFHYITPEMSEDESARTQRVDEQDLIKYIIDFELADQSDMAELLLHNAFEEVKDRYWADIQCPTLTSNYEQAMAFMASFIEKCNKPLSESDADKMRRAMKAEYGVDFGRRAA